MKSVTMEEHRKESPVNVYCGVITLSDSKAKDEKEGRKTDVSGRYIISKLNEKYDVNRYEIIPDERDSLLQVVEGMISGNIDVIFTTGGTGIGSRDITIETIESLLEKELKGFGEIFRLKTYKELGSVAMLSRAIAGVYKESLIFSMPGSPNAVKLGMGIIIDELPHLKKHLKE